MTSRSRMRKLKKAMQEDENLQISMMNFQEALDKSLQSVSPGAFIQINPDKVGFFIYTPNERMELDSVALLGAILQFSPLIGEQALVYAVNRTNSLASFMYSIMDPVPKENLIRADEFMDRMIQGKAFELGAMVEKLNKLGDAEGAAFGMMMSLTISTILQPFSASIAAPDDSQLLLKIGNSKHPILSPTIFLYVLRNLVLETVEDVAKAAVISNIIQNPYAYAPDPSNN
jgi:hypothetical protein